MVMEKVRLGARHSARDIDFECITIDKYGNTIKRYDDNDYTWPTGPSNKEYIMFPSTI